jgi:serine/threonine-protein kinase HipA
MAKTKRLGVWLDDLKVAELNQGRWPNIRCQYTDEALDRWPLNSPVISCALPLSTQSQDALAFCKGLLPEGQALEALAARARVPVNYTFELLDRYGRDVAGALVISAEEPEPRRFGVEPYDDQSLAEAIGELDEYPLGVHDDSELSLAGLQDKLLLVELEDGSWGRPLHGRPSTHILKIEDRRFPGMAAAEAACLQLARELGLTTIECSLETIADIPCLIVSRFDRRTQGEEIERIHQEDLCQAFAIDPAGERGRAKYEKAGGPQLKQAAAVLEAWAADPQYELEQLLAAATFTVVIGNADAHGKNLSLIHSTPTEVALAPLYDTVPTALWPTLRTDAAMSLDGKFPLAEITAEDLVNEARTWSLTEERARVRVELALTQITGALDSGVVDGDSELGQMMRRRAEELLS